MKVTIDLSKCVMSGQCYYFHSDLVRMRKNGHPEIIETGVEAAEEEAIADLVEMCPMMAIELSED